ncbi:cytochrome c oxidase subunit IV [Microbacterium sp. Root53]|uniref:aa3-type cytochrome oxidase subunit IV n=1 Tax=Microbacterium sp. Root53 TaxID=1736553 RepID=UPI0006F76063|nr:cytochrome c oxidase subunit 4 [Microbacterium sp. Root53]KQY98785.1 cytochrome c oxidase subunit IV [Microbacterium sp. Root53]
MRSNIGLWWLLAGFFGLMAVVYTAWSIIAQPDLPWYQAVEWAGSTAFAFAVFMSAMVAFYIQLVHKGQHGVALPEDRDDADIDDGDAELGEFSPWSWWPLVLAGSAAIAIISLAVAQFLLPLALGLFAVAIVGWVYEYYRGYFAR